jgi:hypothetical protein
MSTLIPYLFEYKGKIVPVLTLVYSGSRGIAPSTLNHENIQEWPPSNPTCLVPSVQYTGRWAGLRTRLDISEMMIQSRGRFFYSPTGSDWL